MPEKIGKYEVVERIGRGGMGMIFKAHDPVLDRAVALKLISTDVEVTDELRARFFREAQACARLSHPNIVTIYDMGEHDGRLYIVMELLDGEELRHLIAQRTPLELEDKVSVMLQVCDGLHYAHRRGIVHRDIKPANIFLLRSGQAKILDFGIAQVATTQADLTRTGLIMGTLRYISPEQVRGEASSRSDIFSVGAVFYELLSLQAPFTGSDPMNLLEQLRSADPMPLRQIDPSIPSQLAAAVERALRKDPAERFADLDQMRRSIEAVQQTLREAAERVREHLRDQLSEISQLQRRLSDCIGALPEIGALPAIDKLGRLSAMRAIEEDFRARIEALRRKVALAESLTPALNRGSAFLKALHFAEAAAEFEAIVAEMPEHTRAREALRQARALAEEQRRHQLTAQILRDARAAYDEGGYALCLHIIEQAADIPVPTAMLPEISSLRHSAEVRLAAQEAARHERQRADRAREQMAQARRACQAEEAPRYAAPLWSEAEVKAAEADTHLVQEGYAQAAQAFEQAQEIYRSALEASSAARTGERESAERGRDKMGRALRDAETSNAPQYAQDLWKAAEAKAAEAQSAFDRQSLGQAARLFDEAALLYGQAGDTARAAWERLRQRAEHSRARAMRGRENAADAGAEQDAARRWAQAVAKFAQADTALRRAGFSNANRAFGEAELLFRQAASEADETRQRRRLQCEQARDGMEEARDRALANTAPGLAQELWTEAERGRSAAETAFASERYAEAADHFERALRRYADAAVDARETARLRDQARSGAESEQEAARVARQVGFEARAPRYAPREWTLAEDASQRADAASSRQEHTAACALFAEARALYAAAVEVASAAVQGEARRVDAMMDDARRFLEAGEAAACLVQLSKVFALRPNHPLAASLRAKAETALRQPAQDSVAEQEAATPLISASAGVDVTKPGPQSFALEALAGDASAGDQTRSGDATALLTPCGRTTMHRESAEEAARPPRSDPRGGVDGARPEAVGSSARGPAVDAMAKEESLPRGADGDALDDATAVAVPKADAAKVSKGLDVGTRAVPEAARPVTQTEMSRNRTADAHGDLTIVALPRGLTPPPGSGRTALPEVDTSGRGWPRRLRVGAAVIGAGAVAVAAAAFVIWRPAPPSSPPVAIAPPSTQTSVQPPPAAPVESPAALTKADVPTSEDQTDTAATQDSGAKQSTDGADGETALASKPPEPTAPAARTSDPQQSERPRAATPPSESKADARLQPRARREPSVTPRPPQTQSAASLPARARSPELPKLPEPTPVPVPKAPDALPVQRQVASLRADTEQAQTRMVASRRAAEQAGASFYAPKLVAAAKAKERDAAAAADQSDFARATRLLAEAQSMYQTAALDSKRDADSEWQRTLGLKASAEQLRARAAGRRDAAVKAEADRLAKDLFERGQAKQSDGDAQFGEQKFQAAAQSYQDAAQRYLEATARAQGVRDAR